ncbi:MAG: hypothetical protein L0154_27980 [Chloroflexi bacterium]|nr:hypothetical protein [Chloroflexota bacterium]
MAGRLQDDDDYFNRAYELIEETNGRTAVYIYDVEVSEEILEGIQSWYNDKHEALYNFPDQSGQLADKEYNCAMFLKVFDIPLPARTGSLKALTDKMKTENYDRWHPKDVS